MIGINWRQRVTRILFTTLLVAILGLVSCTSPQAPSIPGLSGPTSRLSEVAPPKAILELREELEKYQPQVQILSPRSGETVQDTTVSIRLQVNDLPVFKDEDLGLGPHLHFILDNQPYEAIYDASTPVVLKDLAPGTHTIRVFASRPWHESFKNEGAYAQTTFHVFAQTPENNPVSEQPLLTYSRPKGDYGAEPIMLDFYLTDAPLHLVARENLADDILDWKIRCTVNGESFTFDRWEPIYLKGFKPGRNWVQLELLDERDNLYFNPFNNTVRLINYEPGGTDTLSKLTRGELSALDAMKIVDPNYVPPVPEPEPELEPSLEPGLEPEPGLEAEPDLEPGLKVPEFEIVPPLTETEEIAPEAEPAESQAVEEAESERIPLPAPIEAVPTATEETNDRQLPAASEIEPLPPTLPEIVPEEPEPGATVKDQLQQEVQQELENLGTPILPGESSPDVEEPSSPAPIETAPVPSIDLQEPSPAPESGATPEKKQTGRTKGFFDRFLPRSAPKSSPESSVTPSPVTPTPTELEEGSAPEAEPNAAGELQISESSNSGAAIRDSQLLEQLSSEIPAELEAPEPESTLPEVLDSPLSQLPTVPSRYQPPISLTLRVLHLY
ncbi:MAG: hypothetical protein Kow00121_02060 [Elainellaceae cyanobacterium]